MPPRNKWLIPEDLAMWTDQASGIFSIFLAFPGFVQPKQTPHCALTNPSQVQKEAALLGINFSLLTQQPSQVDTELPASSFWSRSRAHSPWPTSGRSFSQWTKELCVTSKSLLQTWADMREYRPETLKAAKGLLCPLWSKSTLLSHFTHEKTETWNIWVYGPRCSVTHSGYVPRSQI